MDNPPKGAMFKGYVTYNVQEIVTSVRNIQFQLARWELSDGKTITEEVPEAYKDNHFGPELRKHIVYQAHQNRVPQNKILQELIDKGIQISAGQINAILEKTAESLSSEYDEVLEAGVTTSKQINTDDTNGRHQGKNCYTTTLGNEVFTYLHTSDTKSRANFLRILTMEEEPGYTINQNAFEYSKEHKLGRATQVWFESCAHKSDISTEVFKALIETRALSKRDVRILQEACLYATCIENGLPFDLKVVSDGAGQFDLFDHALCWIHAERAIKKLIPVTDDEAAEIKLMREKTWDFYAELKEYQKNPSEEKKIYLSKKFDDIFSTITKNSLQLPPILKKFRDNKDKLLLGLKFPYVPLHNNLAERDLRHTVIQRKISGGTRSSRGKRARDTFASLFKTCQKNKISIWNYLSDRLHKTNLIANLGDIIQLRNSTPIRAPSIS